MPPLKNNKLLFVVFLGSKNDKFMAVNFFNFIEWQHSFVMLIIAIKSLCYIRNTFLNDSKILWFKKAIKKSDWVPTDRSGVFN